MRDLILPVLFLQVSVISAAPLLQWLQTNQMTPLQRQWLELQAMQQFYPISQMGMNTLSIPHQPLLIILPDDQTSTDTDISNDNQLERRQKENVKPNTKENDDAIVIDAEPIPTIDGSQAIILLPNAKSFIGDFISAIPFLPIEINVPDTISWIGSGISGIISGVVQSFPFQRPSQNTMGNVGVKSNINIQTSNTYTSNVMKPMLIMPLSGLTRQILPVQFKK